MTGRIFWQAAGVNPKEWREGDVMRRYRLYFRGSDVEGRDASPKGPGERSEPNMLALGDFEEVGLGAYQKQGWSLRPGATITRAKAHTGKAALRLQAPHAPGGSTCWSTVQIRVRPGEQYDVSMWWRAREAKGDYVFAAYFYCWDRDRGYVGRTQIGSAGSDATFEWRCVRRQVEIPAGVAFLAAGATSRCVSGELHVDDVRIAPVAREIRRVRRAAAAPAM